MRRPELIFEFPAQYGVDLLDRIDRTYGRAFAYPGALGIDMQQELADAPILGISLADGKRWIGVFRGGDYRSPPAARAHVLGWPDERSLCVVYRGVGSVVRTDDPAATYEIEVWPVCDTVVIPSHELVLFADFTHACAYGPDGLVWQSRRLVLDDMEFVRIEGNVVRCRGFFGGGPLKEFTVDLETGEARDRPYEPPD